MRSETGACAHESTDQETPCGDSNRHDRGGSVDNNRDGTDEHTQPLLHSAKTERAHRALSSRLSDNDTVTNTITVGTRPYGVAVTPDGSTAYVTNVESNSVSRIDT